MPDLPWTTLAKKVPGRESVAMASHLPLARISATLRFFHAGAAVPKQLSEANGLVGYTLRAKPFARDYYTLSEWEDESVLGEFMRTAPHARIMGSLRPLMGSTKFWRWTLTSADGRPTWNQAIDRLRTG